MAKSCGNTHSTPAAVPGHCTREASCYEGTSGQQRLYTEPELERRARGKQPLDKGRVRARGQAGAADWEKLWGQGWCKINTCW